MFGFEGVLDRVDAGFIVPGEDVEATAAGMVRLATDGALRARLAWQPCSGRKHSVRPGDAGLARVSGLRLRRCVLPS